MPDAKPLKTIFQPETIMETVESLKWLKDRSLYDLAYKTSLSLKKIFTPCLGVKDEKVLIVGDTGYENRNVAAVMSAAYYLAAEQLKLDAKLILQDVKSRDGLRRKTTGLFLR